MAKSNKPIRAEELTAYERWELPNIDGGAINKSRSATVRKPVKPLTADDLEKIRQEAYQAGFEEGKKEGFEQGKQEGLIAGKKQGHQDGFKQGMQDGQVKIDQTVAQLRQCLQNLSNPIQEQAHLVEQAMLNLALAVSRAVIHRELKLDSTQVLATIQNAIQHLPDMSTGIKVRLSPQDAEFARQAKDSFENAFEVIADPSVQAGGCLMETSSQLIDYTIEKRFQKTVHSMLFEASKSDMTPIETSTSINELSDYSSETLDEAEQELENSSSDHEVHEASPELEGVMSDAGANPPPETEPLLNSDMIDSSENHVSDEEPDSKGDGHESV